MKIIFVPDACRPSDVRHVEGYSSLIDWLELEFPGGLPVNAFDAADLRRLAPEELGAIEPCGTAIVVAAPRGLETALIVILAVTIVATAASLALALIAAPSFSQPGLSNEDDVSPTYSLNLPTNQARLGSVIPVPYGRITHVPDLASAPWAEFTDDGEEVVYTLLCIGPGFYQIDRLLIEQSAVDALPDGVFEWRAYSQDDHGQVMGAIESDFDFPENVVTSSVVSDVELNAPDQAAINQATFTRGVDFLPPNTVRIYGVHDEGQGFDDGSEIMFGATTVNQVGDPVISPSYFDITTAETVSAAAASEVVVYTTPADTVYSVEGGRQVLEWEVAVGSTSEVTEGGQTVYTPDPVPALPFAQTDHLIADYGSDVAVRVFTISTGYRFESTFGTGDDSDVEVGRQYYATYRVVLRLQTGTAPSASASGAAVFSTQGVQVSVTANAFRDYLAGYYTLSSEGALGDEIALDFVFPGGLYTRNASSGAFEGRTVDILVEWDRIDNSGVPTGLSGSQTFTFTQASRKPLRATRKISVVTGRYRARVRRVTATSTDAADQDQVLLRRIKFKLQNSSGVAYGPVTLIATKAKASRGLSGNALRQIKTKVRRLLPQIGNFDWSFNAMTTSRRASNVIFDLLFNPDYGAGFDQAKYDNRSFFFTTAELRDAAITFDGVVDAQSNTFELLRSVGQHSQVEPAYSIDGLGLVIDGPRSVRSFVFAPDNIAAGSFRRSWKTRGYEPYDGVEVRYWDESKSASVPSLFPANSVRPRILDLSRGLTSSSHAREVAIVAFRSLPIDDQGIEFETELEGRLINRLDRIGVSWPQFGGRRIARVLSEAGGVLTLDRGDWDLTANVWIIVRGHDGSTEGPLQATLANNLLTPSAALATTIYGEDSDRQMTTILLAPSDLVVDDYQVTEVEPGNEGRVRINARKYDASRWQGTVFASLEVAE